MGWATVGFMVISAAIGWGWGWLEFRGIALFAAMLLVVAVLWTLRKASHEVSLQLAQPRVQAGEPGWGQVVLTGRSGGTPATLVELPVGKAVARFRVGALGERDTHEEAFSIPTRRRGVIPVGPVRTVQADPLGMLRRATVQSEQLELFIHPQVVMVDAAAIGFLKDVEGITTANLSSSDVSFHALRDYIPGDDRRAVHWRTTARTGRLMVRQFEETLRAHLLLVLSTTASDYADPEHFEMAVSVAASLTVAALREERQVSIFTSSGPLPFASTMGLLDQLCRVELSANGPTMAQLALRAGNEVSGASVAGLITGSTEAVELRAAQLRLPPQIATFAVRNHAGWELARHQVGEVTIIDLPSVAQLPLAMRSLP